MSSLTTNRDTKERAGSVRRYPVLNDEIMYAGGMAAILGSSGELEMASDKAGLIVVGRCEEEIDNSADGEYSTVKTGCFLFDNSISNAVTKAHIGGKTTIP